MSGGADDDIIKGNGGADILDGDGGHDVITGGPGRDRINGGSGPDTIKVRGGGVDRVDCGSDIDHVIADRSDIVRNCEFVNGKRVKTQR